MGNVAAEVDLQFPVLRRQHDRLDQAPDHLEGIGARLGRRRSDDVKIWQVFEARLVKRQ
jgi:hypothetical protein